MFKRLDDSASYTWYYVCLYVKNFLCAHPTNNLGKEDNQSGLLSHTQEMEAYGYVVDWRFYVLIRLRYGKIFKPQPWVPITVFYKKI